MYIKDSSSISPQMTFTDEFLTGDYKIHSQNSFTAFEPSYSETIPSSLLRRMGKAVRMGIGAALPLMDRNEKLDGIVIGTANGGLENCINFLNQIIDYDEGTLTPTHFVQSTPNALAGQLALMSKNTGYNVTHVNGPLAFENALLDAMMFLEGKITKTSLLLGAVEEISNYNYNIDLLAGRYKSDSVTNDYLIKSQTNGSICGEGATMFVVSNDENNALAKIVDLKQINFPTKSELEIKLNQFFIDNELTLKNIDLLVLGNNGDIQFDFLYDDVKSFFPADIEYVYYKNFVGDYRTSSAFALFLTTHLLNGQLQNHIGIEGNITKTPKTILIYNQFEGIQHSLIIVESIEHQKRNQIITSKYI